MADENKQLSGIDQEFARFGRRATFATAFAATLALGGAANAQTAAAPTAEEIAPVWMKICNTDPKTNKSICVIAQEKRTDGGQFLASVAIFEPKGEKRKNLRVLIPPGMMIQPGVRLRIDKSKENTMKYSICFPNACLVELPIDAKFVGKMKKGNDLIITALNQQAKPVQFKLTLAGFTASYDGEGLDPAAVQKKEKELQEKLRERAKAARQLLIDEQNKAREKAN